MEQDKPLPGNMPNTEQLKFQEAIELRDYQSDLIQKIYAAWAHGYKRVMAQLPTAAGKTLCFTQVAKEFATRGEKVIILTHRQELIDQAVSKLTDITTISVGVIKSGVCPDLSALIQVASVQSLKSRLSSYKNISVVIVDEAHHSSAKSWQEILSRFPTQYLLGVTATPIRLDGSGFNDRFDVLIQGESIERLIEQGYLAKYRLFADPHEMKTKGASGKGGDYNVNKVAKQNNVIELAGHLIDSYHRHAKGLQAIVFAISIEHSKSITERYNKAGITAAHLDGTTPIANRIETIAQFRRGEIQVLVNCNLFDEGVDLPSVGCVQIARPTRSLSRYLQTIGRGFRPAPGKEYTIIIDHTHNYRTHGLPDEKREWSLEGVKIERQKLWKTKDGEIVGEKSQNSWKEIIEIVEIDLQEVKRYDYPADFIDRYNQGESMASLASELGCGSDAVRNWLKKQNVTLRSCCEPPVIPPSIVEDYGRGESIESIRKRLGISYNSIYKYLTSKSIPIRKLEKELDNEKIQKEYINGKSLSSLAKQFQVSAQTIKRALTQQGVTLRLASEVDIPADFKYRYERGENSESLAKEAGVSGYIIRRWLEKQGVKIVKNRSRISIGISNEFLNRYNNGELESHLAKELGISNSAMRNWLKSKGATIRTRKNKNKS